MASPGPPWQAGKASLDRHFVYVANKSISSCNRGIVFLPEKKASLVVAKKILSLMAPNEKVTFHYKAEFAL